MSRAPSLILLEMFISLCKPAYDAWASNSKTPAKGVGPSRGAATVIFERYCRFTSVSSPLSALTLTEKLLPPRFAAKL